MGGIEPPVDPNAGMDPLKHQPGKAVGRNAIFLPRKNQGDINFGRRIRTFDHGVMVLSSRFARDKVLLLLNKSAVLTT